MIAWEPSPYIFVHIPKCAGTSIEQALIPVSTPHQGFKDFPQELRGKYWLPGPQMLQHSKLRRYARQFSIADFFKFSIVRNPWERAISQIEYLKSKGVALFSDTRFKENLRTYCSSAKHPWGHDLGACQLDFLSGPTGEIAVDYIGRFETLAIDFEKICRRLKLDPVPVLPHVFNSGRVRPYRDYYDDESQDWVRKRFARDITHLGYEF